MNIAHLIALAAAVATPAPAEKPKAAPAAPEPFYERYLSDDLLLDREIRVLEKRCAEEPKNANLHNDLGNLLAMRSFPKDAHAEYGLARKLDRNLYIAEYNDGLLYEKQGNSERAIESFRRTIKMKPGMPEAHFHLALLLERRDRVDEAIRHYAEAMRIDNRLREPAFNPLAVQSRLLYRASLSNYRTDLATADLQASGQYADPGVVRALSPEKPIYAEASPPSDEETEETEAAPAGARSVPLIGTAPVPSSVKTRGEGIRESTPMNQTTPFERPNSRQNRRRPVRRSPPQSIPIPAPPTAAPQPANPAPPVEGTDETPVDDQPPPGGLSIR